MVKDKVSMSSGMSSGMSSAKSSGTTAWYRRKWFVATVGVTLFLLIAGGSAAVIANRPQHVTSSVPTVGKWTVIAHWWSEAGEDFKATRDASDDVQHAIDYLDPFGLEAACQRLHDDAEVKLKAHSPTPEPDLTAELNAAIEDYHTASHMCLAVAAGSANSYVGEFKSYLDQGDIHMKAAQDIINQTLIET